MTTRDARSLRRALGLYLVIGEADTRGRDLLDVVEAAVAGGVSLVQLREKTAATRRQVELAAALVERLRPEGVPVIVNDRVDVALAAGADGVHLGQDDMDPRSARRLLGEKAILGLSVGDAEEARTAVPGLVDYVGLGPVHATGTKTDAGAPLGVEGVAALRRLVAGFPAVGIGGIDLESARALRGSGLDGLAVVSAIARAEDPEAAARALGAAFAG